MEAQNTNYNDQPSAPTTPVQPAEFVQPAQPIQSAPPVRPKFKAKKWIIIVAVIAAIGVALLIGGVILYLNAPFYGTWNCSNGPSSVILKIDSKNFNMDYEDDSTVEAEYKVSSINVKSGATEYILDVSTTKRIFNGTENFEPYTTQFSVIRDGDELLLMNTVTYSIYTCRVAEDGLTPVSEAKKAPENHTILGTESLGYMAYPNTWTVSTAGLGAYIYIYPDIDGLTFRLEKSYHDDKDTDSNYSDGTITPIDKNAKVGKYDATLSISEYNNRFRYEWSFTTDDGQKRWILMESEDEDVIKDYMYILDSYSLTN